MLERGEGGRSTFVAPTRLAEQLWMLGTCENNLYLVRGRERSPLVEFGVSGIVDEVLRQLATLEARPDYLVLTHPHADHVTAHQTRTVPLPSLTTSSPCPGRRCLRAATGPS
jgi:glyoxylase-like metal-dependent hydrolase (beta-lactamase superfamily II)